MTLNCYHGNVIRISRSVIGQRDSVVTCEPNQSALWRVELARGHHCLLPQEILCDGLATCDHVTMVDATCGHKHGADFQVLFYECVKGRVDIHISNMYIRAGGFSLW